MVVDLLFIFIGKVGIRIFDNHNTMKPDTI